MVAHEDNDFFKLTFSQREGKALLPEPMQPEHLPQKFRQLVWQAIATEIVNISSNNKGNIYSIIDSYQFDIRGQFHDEIEEWSEEDYYFDFCKEWIRDESYHEVLTFIEFILRNEDCSEDLRKGLLDTFEKAPIAYFIDDKDGLPTIMPRVNREAGEAAQQAIETLRKNNLEGATTHLRQAAEDINERRYAHSIANSIHAVESVARRIDPKAGKFLGPALDSLEQAGLLKHRALKEAFKKLYGYTSDEQGIRHALLDKDSADVGLDEAMFMFGACASFAAYLTNKHQQTETE